MSTNGNMKRLVLALLCAAAPSWASPTMWAQTNAFTYQGRLTANGAPASGNYDLRFQLFDAPTAGSQVNVTITNASQVVTDGLFTSTLNFGPGAFPGADRWLEIWVRTNGGGAFVVLAPRQPITPAPYAITAASLSGTLPSDQLAGTYSGPVTFNNGGNAFDGTFVGDFFGLNFVGGGFSGTFLGEGSGLLHLNASQLSSGVVPAAALGNVWKIAGNGGTGGTNFLGTVDNQALELRVNGARALRLEPSATSPNLVGGYGGNSATGGAVGVFVGGGGKAGFPNVAAATFAVVAGGYGNTATGEQAFVGGGTLNVAAGGSSVIGGGSGNYVTQGNATIGGGAANTNIGYGNTIGGGINNSAGLSGYATISGGEGNITVASDATIGGGKLNYASGMFAFIGSGSNNVAAGRASVVGGDSRNVVSGDYAVVGGGFLNSAASETDTVGGGDNNSASGGRSTIAGGTQSKAAGYCATIGGGYFNIASMDNATIGGGVGNTIGGVGYILGGQNATIAGGAANTNNAYCAVIGGGILNALGTNDCAYSTIGGGQGNKVLAGEDTTISGGVENSVSGYYSVIGGGAYNRITSLLYGMTISGGFSNNVSGNYSTVPGGISNVASGAFSFAAGRQANALHQGCFVWGDSTASNVSSSAADQFTVRAAGGARFFSNPSGTTGVALAAGGGSWSNLSDRDSKENFATVDSRQILERVAGMPITAWNYKSQAASVRHIGPMAQDFAAAFAVGEDDKHITTVDESGVALAAIQGLNKKLEDQVRERDEEIRELRQQSIWLEKRLEELERRLQPVEVSK